MKILGLILAFVIIVKSSPVANQRSIDIFWPTSNQFPEILSRQKKSSEHELPTLPDTQNTDNLQDSLKNWPKESLVNENQNNRREEKSSKSPVSIKKNSQNTTEEDKSHTVTSEKCKQVRFNLCDGENELNNMRATSLGTMDRFVSEKEMKDNIKLAKEAMDNLKKDIQKIEQSSMKSHSENDVDFHKKIDVARQALDNIHQNFGNLETLNGLSTNPKEDAVEIELDDEKRAAMWREMNERIQKTGGIFKNPGENTDSNENEHSKLILKNAKSTDLENTHFVLPTTSLKSVNDFPQETINKEFNIMKLSEDSKKSTLDHQENHSKISTTPNLELFKPQTKMNAGEFKTTLLEKGNEMGKENEMAKENEKENIIEKTENLTKDSEKKNQSNELQVDKLRDNENKDLDLENDKDFVVKSIDKNKFIMSKKEMETYERVNNIHKPKLNEGTTALKGTKSESETHETQTHDKINTNSEDKLLRDALRMHSSQAEKLNKMQLNPKFLSDTEKHNGNKGSLVTQKHHHLSDEQTLEGFKSAEVKQDTPQEEMNMGQNNNQNFETGLHTFEDPHFLRSTHEKLETNNIFPLINTQSNFHNEPFKSSMMDENLHQRTDMNTHHHHDLESHEDSLEPHMHHIHDHMHDHMHEHMHSMAHMKSSDMDSSMQPSMIMHMRDPYGRSAMDAMQWSNPNVARTAYASVPSVHPPSGSASGAVGVFPNANLGSCAIPLLLSCSPSLVSGSLAKPTPSHTYSPPAPSYRTGEDLSAYFMKRDTKTNDDFPILKILRTNTPFNHKNELVIDKKLR